MKRRAGMAVGREGMVIARALMSISAVPLPCKDSQYLMNRAVACLADVPGLAEAQAYFLPTRDSLGVDCYPAGVGELQHSLSDVIEGLGSGNPCREDRRSRREFDVYQAARSGYRAARASGCSSAMEKFIISLATDLLGSKAAFRSGDIVVRQRDFSAASIMLPRAIASRQRATAILDILVSTSRGQVDIATAVWIYILFLNSHPLSDGNGRVARLLFNLHLRDLGMGDNSYVPIYSAMRHSRGGYEIRLREAEIFNRWDPILQFMSRVVLISAGKGASH